MFVLNVESGDSGAIPKGLIIGESNEYYISFQVEATKAITNAKQVEE